MMRRALELGVDLAGGLGKQKKAPAEHDQIASAHTPGGGHGKHLGDMEQWRRQLGNPDGPHKEEEPQNECQGKSDRSCALLIFGVKPAHKDGNEDDIVDPEYDLQYGERKKGDHAVGGEECFHGCKSKFVLMTFISIDPSTEKSVAEFPEQTPNDVARIIALAAEAQQAWSQLSIADRVSVVVRLADVLDESRDTAAQQITLEMGKPLSQARAEVEKCAAVCRYMATIAPSVLADEVINAGFRESRVRAEPLGLILSIMPWNFPMWQFFRFAAPALIAGNGVLLKHAPSTMGCALMAVDLCRKAGIPDGLVSALFIDIPQVESVIAHPLVAAVTFTGSTKGGRSVAEMAGRYIKRTVLELGGSDAYVVLDDADLDVAVNACVTGRLLNAGQSCIGAKRYLVHSSVHDEFVERTAYRFDAAVIGHPMEAATEVGPLARADLRQTLLDQVSHSLMKGARLATRRSQDDVPSTGWYVPPMLLVDVDSSNPAFREELFGPVATVTRFDSDAEAVRLANDSIYGLGAAVFSKDHDRARSIADQLHVGTVFINDFVRSHSALPFGGVKQSGYGRELGRWGMLEFVNVKNITTG